MATTQNTYTGNGSTTNYSFTFEYLKQSDVKVTLDTVATTAFTFANATTLAFTSAPANGVAIRIFRATAIDLLSATFFPGSAIKAEDLNQNFTQSLYVTQESDDEAAVATAAANAATTAANTATTTANTALTNAATANTTANAAAATANTANTNANTAISDSATALSTANSANAAVSNAVLFTLVANVAAIPGSPSNNDFIEVSNSTGIQSFTPLSGVPGGFVGDSGLTARIRYDGSSSSWVWMSYFPNDSETRYSKSASPTFTGTPTAPTASQGTDTTQVATTAFVNAEIADTAKRDTTNTFTALQTLNAGLTVDGPYKQTAEAVGALDIDLATGNYFTKTINANSTFTFSNPPASGTVGSFTLELTHTSGTVTWPASVKFPLDTAPTLTAGKTHLFVFVTDDGGTRYRGAALADYVN